jgi:dihydropteroate synthase
LSKTFSLIDVGAHSTAPKNPPVYEAVELDRFKEFLFPHLPHWDKKVALSLDTFRPKVFLRCLKENPHLHWVFNDVSGHLDDEVVSLLEKHPHVSYVLGHNLGGERELAPFHQDFPLEGPVVDSIESFFKEKMKKAPGRVILDPLFGFSKNHQQNWTLLRSLPELILRFPPDQVFLVGISKKSFLRRPFGPHLRSFQESEYLHFHFLVEWMEKLRGRRILFRVHEPEIWKLALKAVNLPIEKNHPIGHNLTI